MKQIAFWSVVFAVFGIYATGVLTYAYQAPGVEAAYAKTIKDTDNHGKKHGIYIAASARQNAFARILDRLELRAAKERELCEVTEAQMAELSHETGFDIEETDIGNGKKVKVATPHKTLFADDFKKRDIHCMKLAVWERLILSFSARVS